jgi:hypothetical protein
MCSWNLQNWDERKLIALLKSDEKLSGGKVIMKYVIVYYRLRYLTLTLSHIIIHKPITIVFLSHVRLEL